MTRIHTLIVLGVLVALAPFIGLPYSWLAFVLPLYGVIIIGTALSLRRTRTPIATPPPVTHEEETQAFS